MAKNITGAWRWHFDSGPAAVWAVLADTARLNEATGFPKYQVTERAGGDGAVTYHAALKAGPFSIRWREVPVEWVSNQRFVHCRIFENGPFAHLCATLKLEEVEGGTDAIFTVEAAPANLLGRLILATGFMRKTGKTYGAAADDIRRFLDGASDRPYGPLPPTKTGSDLRARLDRLIADIDASPYGHKMGVRLADYLMGAQEADIMHLRPLALAAIWQVDARKVIELCLVAADAGMLEMQWDILCPNCRGAKDTVLSLDALPDGVHCPSCNIDYQQDYSRNVELSFRPAPLVRETVAGNFCLFGPMTTPHVKLQQTLSPGEERAEAACFIPGPYRYRCLNGNDKVEVTLGLEEAPSLVVTDDGVAAGEASEKGSIRLVNQTDREITVIVESREWVAEALTADRVSTLQAFRDLCAGQVLRAGDEATVRQVTLMFTDLRGSTALYEQVGDGRAYQIVRDHFALLGGIVRDHSGAVVKTIGDAIMAAFSDPSDALLAAQEIQRHIGDAVPGGMAQALVVRAGLHAGACVAVTLNGRLDYFGGAVNLAARLEGQSAGGDIVLSADMAEDPAVARLLTNTDVSHEVAELKGISAPVHFCRLRGFDKDD